MFDDFDAGGRRLLLGSWIVGCLLRPQHAIAGMVCDLKQLC